MKTLSPSLCSRGVLCTLLSPLSVLMGEYYVACLHFLCSRGILCSLSVFFCALEEYYVACLSFLCSRGI